MAGENTISSVVGTPSAPTTGYTVVEQYLEKKYLAEREFNTPLVQSSYFSKLNLPKMAGQYIKFTRRNKMRLPEVAKESTDPLSASILSYEQINAPIEFINDYVSISVMAQMTSWLDLAKDAKELTFEAIRRYLNRAVQSAFLLGRAKPGYRNASGVTVGDATNPHFWTEAEATVTLYGQSFTFQKAPCYFGNGKTAFSDLQADDYATIQLFRNARVRMKNAGARPFGDGKYAVVLSDSMKSDLERDDEYFQMAIRNQKGQDSLFKGEIADYAGIHWIGEDEPWALERGGSDVTYVSGGDTHVAQMFGEDSFGVMRLGGMDAARPTFKVQDTSKTGNVMTIGYLVPSQCLVLQPDWCANIIAPVREPGANNA
jgi:N4-gp56 family major capsid protein